MDEHVLKKKIQNIYAEPNAPESLIEKVILRTQAVTMGMDAQQQLEAETTSSEEMARLASLALIGQLAAVTELPEGTQPEELALLLEQEPAFQAALRGGRLAQRVHSGELMQQMVEPKPLTEEAPPELSVPVKEGPAMGQRSK